MSKNEQQALCGIPHQTNVGKPQCMHTIQYGKVPPRIVRRSVPDEWDADGKPIVERTVEVHQYGVACTFCGMIYYVDTPIVDEESVP